MCKVHHPYRCFTLQSGTTKQLPFVLCLMAVLQLPPLQKMAGLRFM